MSTTVKLQKLFLLALGGAILAAGGCERPAENRSPVKATDQVAPEVATTLDVEVEVDFQNETPVVRGAIELPPGTTAFSALEALAEANKLAVESTGDGETRFVVAIGPVANQGAGGDNWTYRVNGQLGDRSSGIFQLKPGDKVLWVFGKYP